MLFETRLFRSHLSLAVLCLSTSFFFLSVIGPASAEVGLMLGGETKPLVMDMKGRAWKLIDGACFVGHANNLVVDPVLLPEGNDFMGPQEFEFSHTGPRLCRWLDSLYEAHEAVRHEWEAAHNNYK